jgi:hypothetical protein
MQSWLLIWLLCLTEEWNECMERFHFQISLGILWRHRKIIWVRLSNKETKIFYGKREPAIWGCSFPSKSPFCCLFFIFQWFHDIQDSSLLINLFNSELKNGWWFIQYRIYINIPIILIKPWNGPKAPHFLSNV